MEKLYRTEFQNEQLAIIIKGLDAEGCQYFHYSMNPNDNDICIWRNTPRGLTNLIISTEECLTFSFISAKGSEEKDVLYFNKEIGDLSRMVKDFAEKTYTEDEKY